MQNGSRHSFPSRSLQGKRTIPPEVSFYWCKIFIYFSPDSTWEWWEPIRSNGRNFSIVEYRHDGRLGMSAKKHLEIDHIRGVLPAEQRDWRWKLPPFQGRKDREIRVWCKWRVEMRRGDHRMNHSLTEASSMESQMIHSVKYNRFFTHHNGSENSVDLSDAQKKSIVEDEFSRETESRGEGKGTSLYCEVVEYLNGTCQHIAFSSS